MPNKNKKIAFVISPIGEPDSATRKRADQILKHMIYPVVSELGYEPLRADKISKPGIITSQIITHILNDPLVIADLSGHNPNVFYELAVRHTVKKPIIQIIQDGERIPFDVATTRTIKINHQDLDSVDKAKKELKKQIQAVEKDPSLVDSPISMAVDLQLLKQSSDPGSKTMADLTKMIHDISYTVKEIQYQTRDREPKERESSIHGHAISPTYIYPSSAYISPSPAYISPSSPYFSPDTSGQIFLSSDGLFRVVDGDVVTEFTDIEKAREYAKDISSKRRENKKKK